MVITYETAMLCVAVATLVVLMMKNDDKKRSNHPWIPTKVVTSSTK